MMTKSIIVAMFLSVLVIGTVNAAVIEDFESYTSDGTLQAAWTRDPYAGNPQLLSRTRKTDHTTYMELSGNMGNPDYWDLVTRNYGHNNWTGADTLKLDYRGATGKSGENLQVELVKGSDWSQVWQSPLWAYTNDGNWHTKAIDISSCTWLNDVGPVRLVVKATDVVNGFGNTSVGIDNLEVIPEPASLLLLGSGLVGLFGFAKKKK